MPEITNAGAIVAIALLPLVIGLALALIVERRYRREALARMERSLQDALANQPASRNPYLGQGQRRIEAAEEHNARMAGMAVAESFAVGRRQDWFLKPETAEERTGLALNPAPTPRSGGSE